MNSDCDNIMKENSFVVLYIGYNILKLVHLDPAVKFHDNIRGNFNFNDFYGKPYGSKIYSKNQKGFVYAMRPDPHLFTLSSNHLTQILFQADISIVLHMLDLKPGHVVFESGTGSCSLTTSLCQRVGPTGTIYTFEFNNGRYLNAVDVTNKMGMKNIKCHWQNVLTNGFVIDQFIKNCPQEQQDSINNGTEIIDLKDLKEIEFKEIADAIFLDLPSPEKVIKHANEVLKKGGRLCSFSPCIEQIQLTIKELSRQNYLDFKTIEVIEREMVSKKIPDENLLRGDNETRSYGLYVTNNDQKMHTGYLLFATKYSLE